MLIAVDVDHRQWFASTLAADLRTLSRIVADGSAC